MPRKRLLVPTAIAKYLAERGDLEARFHSVDSKRWKGREAVLSKARSITLRRPAIETSAARIAQRKCRFSGDPLSRTYINQLVQAAVQCWKWLLSEGLVAAGCVASLQAVVQTPPRPGRPGSSRVLPPAPGWDRVLHFLTPTIRAMVLVQVSGGMRPRRLQPGQRLSRPQSRGTPGRAIARPTKKGTGFVQPLQPHEHWHVDVSYLNIAGTFYFLCSILDGCSRFIVHWEIREKMEETDVETIIQRAREKSTPAPRRASSPTTARSSSPRTSRSSSASPA